MKYILFAGSNYYPVGGMNDCIGYSNNLEESISKIEEYDDVYGKLYDWGHIFDCENNKLVYEFKS